MSVFFETGFLKKIKNSAIYIVGLFCYHFCAQWLVGALFYGWVLSYLIRNQLDPLRFKQLTFRLLFGGLKLIPNPSISWQHVWVYCVVRIKIIICVLLNARRDVYVLIYAQLLFIMRWIFALIPPIWPKVVRTLRTNIWYMKIFFISIKIGLVVCTVVCWPSLIALLLLLCLHFLYFVSYFFSCLFISFWQIILQFDYASIYFFIPKYYEMFFETGGFEITLGINWWVAWIYATLSFLNVDLCLVLFWYWIEYVYLLFYFMSCQSNFFSQLLFNYFEFFFFADDWTLWGGGGSVTNFVNLLNLVVFDLNTWQVFSALICAAVNHVISFYRLVALDVGIACADFMALLILSQKSPLLSFNFEFAFVFSATLYVFSFLLNLCFNAFFFLSHVYYYLTDCFVTSWGVFFLDHCKYLLLGGYLVCEIFFSSAIQFFAWIVMELRWHFGCYLNLLVYVCFIKSNFWSFHLPTFVNILEVTCMTVYAVFKIFSDLLAYSLFFVAEALVHGIQFLVLRVELTFTLGLNFMIKILNFDLIILKFFLLLFETVKTFFQMLYLICGELLSVSCVMNCILSGGGVCAFFFGNVILKLPVFSLNHELLFSYLLMVGIFNFRNYFFRWVTIGGEAAVRPFQRHPTLDFLELEYIYIYSKSLGGVSKTIKIEHLACGHARAHLSSYLWNFSSKVQTIGLNCLSGGDKEYAKISSSYLRFKLLNNVFLSGIYLVKYKISNFYLITKLLPAFSYFSSQQGVVKILRWCLLTFIAKLNLFCFWIVNFLFWIFFFFRYTGFLHPTESLYSYRNIGYSYKIFTLPDIKVQPRLPSTYWLHFPSFLLISGLNSNYWFNEPFLLALQSKELVQFALNNSVFYRTLNGFNLNDDLWRATFNSRILAEFDLFGSHLQFINKNNSASNLIGKYFTQLDVETLSNNLIIKRAYSDNWAYEPEDRSFFNEQLQNNFVWSAFWLAGYVDSWIYETKYSNLRGYRQFFIENFFNWVDYLTNSHWVIALLLNSILMPIEYSFSNWRDFLYFIIDVFEYDTQPLFTSVAFLKFLSDKSGFLEEEFPIYYRRASKLDWFNNFGHTWRWFYLKVFKYSSISINYFLIPKTKFWYLPNLYAIFDYLQEIPSTLLPIQDNYLLLSEREQLLALVNNPRQKKDLILEGYKKNHFRFIIKNFMFSRNYPFVNRSYFGRDAWESNVFFEKPLFHLAYTSEHYLFSMASRRNNLYFSNFSGGVVTAELKPSMGRWDPTFVLFETFFIELYYRLWGSKQTFSMKLLEHERFYFLKFFKNFSRRHITETSTESEVFELLRRFDVYTADKLNNRVAFFFKSLRSQFKIFLNNELFVYKAPSILQAYDYWTLSIFENNYFFFNYGVYDSAVGAWVSDLIGWLISEILNFFSIIYFFFFEFQSPKIITIQESYLKRRFEFKNFSETSLQSESSAELYFLRKFNFFYLESKLGTISNMDALVTYTLKNIM